MNKRDADFAQTLIAHLDRGIDALDAGAVRRLEQARATALAALAGEPSGRPARDVRPADGRHRGWIVATRWAAVALLVIGTGAGWQQWRRTQVADQAHEYADLDTQILSSELPIDALLDRGFQNWLNTSYEH